MHAEIRAEGTNLAGTVDFVICWDEEMQEFVVDLFNTSNPDPNSAYLETFSTRTFDQALSDAQDYIF